MVVRVFSQNIIYTIDFARVYLLMLLSFTSKVIKRILFKVSNVSLISPLICLRVGPYYSNINLQWSTLSVVNWLNVRFLWSVYNIIWCPNRDVFRKCLWQLISRGRHFYYFRAITLCDAKCLWFIRYLKTRT